MAAMGVKELLAAPTRGIIMCSTGIPSRRNQVKTDSDEVRMYAIARFSLRHTFESLARKCSLLPAVDTGSRVLSTTEQTNAYVVTVRLWQDASAVQAVCDER